ncbi:hypothetical protein FKM82_027031 [Ascaphus truei]
MMPSMRQTRPVASKLPRPGRAIAVENTRPEKEEGLQTKRSPSSPQGGPKKRSAFGDITNAHKNKQLLQKKKEVLKVPVKKPKPVQTGGVTKNNEINLKKTLKKITADELVSELVKPENEEDKTSPPTEERTCVAQLPTGIEDIDKESAEDPFVSSEYAKDIFTYMKAREETFLLPNYMETQNDLSKDMRAILVDWMVEVQENFELNHETLYLSVKVVDHYLAACLTKREKLQLIGSTAIFIASKFEERCPPCVDDFLYICDDAYMRQELVTMEMEILRKLDFDINIPVPYRFLRRYAKCAHANMETLTLARFICERTLQEYDFVQESASKMAASCLLLALTMKGLQGWTATLQHYSGYPASELHPLVKRLNFLLSHQPDEKLKAVRCKYSHRVFFEVAKLPRLDMLTLEDALRS